MAEIVSTEGAPRAIGPYAQAVAAGGFVFCSGQIGLDPATGELVGSGVGGQAARALENVRAVLAALGLGPEDVVKTTVFLASMEDFGELNEVYARFFQDHRPARSTIAVRELPKGALVELEVVALARPAGKSG